ncbi:hypothetical protein F5B18DRAFT_651849 [Nemania serpens]|nr:hypothetical protein F5B18DRAFT_651849 [Nemania serpens]
MAIVFDAGTSAAMSGAVTAVSASASARRAQGAYYRSPRSSLDTASYMNHLRAPVPPRAPTNRGVGGVHIHYQGQCPHGPLYPGDNHHRGFHSEGDGDGDGEGYTYPMDQRASRYSYYAGYPNSPCGCSQCYWRDFLTNDIEKYKTKRKQLRETYVWNLRELVRRHRASPTKSREDKDGELEKLYWYYVGRVREIYDNHCRHHRLLFRDACLTWEMPEKAVLSEEAVTPAPSRAPTLHSHRSRSGGLGTPVSLPSSPASVSRGESADPLQTVEAGRIDKGKGKEVLPGAEGEVSSPVGGVDEEEVGAKDKDEGGMTALLMAMAGDTIPKPQPKHAKISMQQRLRQFWPTRVRGRSSDKADLVQESGTDGTKHEGDEYESAA